MRVQRSALFFVRSHWVLSVYRCVYECIAKIFHVIDVRQSPEFVQQPRDEDGLLNGMHYVPAVSLTQRHGRKKHEHVTHQLAE